MPIIKDKDKIGLTNETYAMLVARLTDERKRVGWSRYWLAKQTGLAPITITTFEDNEKRASFDTIIAIAQALGLTIKFDTLDGCA